MFGLFKSITELASDAVEIVSAPVEMAVDLASAAIEPVVDAVRELTDDIKSLKD